jgi:hypothetical protein
MSLRDSRDVRKIQRAWRLGREPDHWRGHPRDRTAPAARVFRASHHKASHRVVPQGRRVSAAQTVPQRNELWLLVDRRELFIRMVAKDYSAELERIDRELETELMR